MEQSSSSSEMEPGLAFPPPRTRRRVFVITQSRPGSFSYHVDLDAYAVTSKEEFDREVEEIFIRRH